MSQALKEKGGSPMKEASWLSLNGVKRGGQLIGNSKEDDIKPTVKINKRMVSVATKPASSNS